jgi:hypothetical protein
MHASSDNLNHFRQAVTIDPRSSALLSMCAGPLAITPCTLRDCCGILSTGFLFVVVNETCLSLNICLPKPSDLVNPLSQSPLQLLKRELDTECRGARCEQHTFGYRLKTIHTRIIIAIVPTANTRYHHQGGFELSTLTFIPKRPYFALTYDEGAEICR